MNPDQGRAIAVFWQPGNTDPLAGRKFKVAEKYVAKYDKAVACLTKDRDPLLAFFDFPAEHWDHLRTSNRIESVFATVRHRTVRTKGALPSKTAKLMVFKLVNAAAKSWRRLKGENQLPKVVQAPNSKTVSRSPKCQLTTPPDRPRHQSPA
jgi:putative transposase